MMVKNYRTIRTDVMLAIDYVLKNFVELPELRALYRYYTQEIIGNIRTESLEKGKLERQEKHLTSKLDSLQKSISSVYELYGGCNVAERYAAIDETQRELADVKAKIAKRREISTNNDEVGWFAVLPKEIGFYVGYVPKYTAENPTCGLLAIQKRIFFELQQATDVVAKLQFAAALAEFLNIAESKKVLEAFRTSSIITSEQCQILENAFAKCPERKWHAAIIRECSKLHQIDSNLLTPAIVKALLQEFVHEVVRCSKDPEQVEKFFAAALTANMTEKAAREKAVNLMTFSPKDVAAHVEKRSKTFWGTFGRALGIIGAVVLAIVAIGVVVASAILTGGISLAPVSAAMIKIGVVSSSAIGAVTVALETAAASFCGVRTVVHNREIAAAIVPVIPVEVKPVEVKEVKAAAPLPIPQLSDGNPSINRVSSQAKILAAVGDSTTSSIPWSPDSYNNETVLEKLGSHGSSGAVTPLADVASATEKEPLFGDKSSINRSSSHLEILAGLTAATPPKGMGSPTSSSDATTPEDAALLSSRTVGDRVRRPLFSALPDSAGAAPVACNA